MRIVAVLAVHRDDAYLANCLSHLVENGIPFAVVDNDASETCRAVLKDRRFSPHLAGYARTPFTGVYRWRDILIAQQQLLCEIPADWHLLVAPDEILHSYADESLTDAIRRADGQGYDVINFDEFVFLPVEADYIPNSGGVQPLRHYYFYEPRYPLHMRAWKKSANVSNVEGAGHHFSSSECRLAPETLALRHYLFLDQEHAFRKYADRVFAPEEVARGWHRNRVHQSAAHFAFPPASDLEVLPRATDRLLSRRNPRRIHYWER